MKKLIAILCAAALTLSLAACGSSATENYVGQTLTGQVTAIDGSAVTLPAGRTGGGHQHPAGRRL